LFYGFLTQFFKNLEPAISRLIFEKLRGGSDLRQKLNKFYLFTKAATSIPTRRE
jgi:hypothetical protein